MVQAILADRKSQTRRIVNPQPFEHPKWGLCWEPRGHGPHKPIYSEQNAFWNPISQGMLHYGCPLGEVGDLLWVRETWAVHKLHDNRPKRCGPLPRGLVVECRTCPDGIQELPGRRHRSLGDVRGKWRPSIHMPRWASRITLEITEIGCERLQDIAVGDCMAEGLDRIEQLGTHFWKVYGRNSTPPGVSDVTVSVKKSMETLWDSINGTDSSKRWEANPWVWVISFKRLTHAQQAKTGKRNCA
jgi:hypothetical protein